MGLETLPMPTAFDSELELTPEPETLAISKAAILRETSHVLASKPFRTSKQCQNFLRYVVLHSVDGREDSLKERVIGAAVLERSPDYNTADDPVVRIRAADVRKRLAMYYQDEGQSASIRITIPSGSYRAVFHVSDQHAEVPPGNAEAARTEHLPEENGWPAALEAPGIVSGRDLCADDRQPSGAVGRPEVASVSEPKRGGKSRSGRRVKVAILSALLVLLVAAASIWFVRSEAQREFNLFWAPTFEQARPPIIYVGSNAVYRLSSSFLQRYQTTHPNFSGLETLASVDKNQPIGWNDLDADDKDFVGLGDVAAAVSISTFFRGRDVRYDLRFGRDMVFGDFRTTPVVLIGAFNNSWTLELNDRMPYRFAMIKGEKGIQGAGHFWQTFYDKDGAPREDYALITREISPKSGEPVIAVAGLDQTGTRAAAEFVSSPALLDAALRKLPAGWQNKKVQIVLHATVVDYVPSGYDVIASSAL